MQWLPNLLHGYNITNLLTTKNAYEGFIYCLSIIIVSTVVPKMTFIRHLLGNWMFPNLTREQWPKFDAKKLKICSSTGSEAPWSSHYKSLEECLIDFCCFKTPRSE